MTTPTPFSGMTADQIIANALTNWGLESLIPVVQGYHTQGLSPDESYTQLITTKEYQKRFDGNNGLRQKGLAVLPEAEYLSRERTIDQQLTQYRLPPGFADTQADKAKLIGNNVGGVELDTRLKAAQDVVTDGAMTGALAYAQANYGLGTGDLMAYFLDPTRAAGLLDKISKASQVGGAAERVGFGAVDTATAERLAAQGLDAGQAASGFSQAAGLNQLTQNVGDVGVTKDDLEKALLEKDAGATQRVQRKQEERKAVFQAGGSYATDKTGVAGLGSANT